MTQHLCNDYGDAPGCLKDADERYTMDFTDVRDGGLIHWCAKCGPLAHSMKAGIEEAFLTRPGFESEFRAAITEAELQQVKS